MKRLATALTTAAALGLTMNTAHADGYSPDYSHAGVNWVEFDLDGPQGTAIELVGSLGLGDYVYLQGKYQYGETDDKFTDGFTIDNVELTQYEISLGVHAPISAEGDVFLDVGLIEGEAKLGSTSTKEDGEVIRFGLRGMISSHVEVSANILRQQVGNSNENGVELGLVGHVNNNLALAFSFQGIDDSEFIKLGLRLNID